MLTEKKSLLERDPFVTAISVAQKMLQELPQNEDSELTREKGKFSIVSLSYVYLHI